MRAIQIKFLQPTNKNSSRLKAFSQLRDSLYETYDHNEEFEDQAKKLVIKYIKKMEWYNIKISGFGSLPNGDFVATLESK
jgi:hypothetical protein